jgi:hypothetical protein
MECLAFVFGLLIVPFVFVVRRELLFNNRYIGLNLITSSLLALVELFTIDVKRKVPNFFLFLFCPLYPFILLRLTAHIFLKIVGRFPRDTSKPLLDLDGDGLFADRLFNLSYFVLATVGPLAVLFTSLPSG